LEGNVKLNWQKFFIRLFAVYAVIVGATTFYEVTKVRAPEVRAVFDFSLIDGSIVKVAGVDRAHAGRMYDCFSQQRCESYPTQKVTLWASIVFWSKEVGSILTFGALWLFIPVVLSKTVQWLIAGLRAPREQ
jgi:hypothetical protein